jgi:signal transduction histidine kinase
MAAARQDPGRSFRATDREAEPGDQISAAAALTLAETRVAQLSRLNDELLGVVSHDLRTPLATILGAIELFDEGVWDDPATRADLVRVIRASGERMRILISDLLDLAQIELGTLTLDRHSMCVPTLLEECLATLQSTFALKGIQYHLAVAPETPEIQADSARLYQAFVNLLGHAIRDTSSGGEIAVTSGPASSAYIFASIRYTGRKVAPEDLAPPFRGFQQTQLHTTRGELGSNLGLYIGKQIIELHGGRLAIEGQPGAGAQFMIFLPVGDVSER